LFTPWDAFQSEKAFKLAIKAVTLLSLWALKRATGPFDNWSLIKETQSNNPGVTDTTLEQVKQPLLEDFLPGKKRDGCSTATCGMKNFVWSSQHLGYSAAWCTLAEPRGESVTSA